MSTDNSELSRAYVANKEEDVLQADPLNDGDEEAAKTKPTAYNFNTNTYATTKSLIAGVMDVALLTSNASQIKLIAKAKLWSAFNISVVTFLSISIALQIAMVICVVIMATSKADLHFIKENDEEHEREKRKIDRINKAVLGISVIITLINVLTSAFE